MIKEFIIEELKLRWTYIKHIFVCQHLFTSVDIDRLLTKFDDDKAKEAEAGLYEHWNCECTCCRCGEKIERRFSFAGWLGDPTTRYPMKSEYEDT